MITQIEDYFSKGCGRCKRFETPECSVHVWHDGLADLRRICTGVGLQETVKWGHPCYEHDGRNIAILGAHRGEFRINFFNPGLLKDPEGLLRKQGPNTQTAGMISIADNAAVQAIEPTLRAYLLEAISYANAGLKQQKTATELELPEELIAALDGDPELAEAFHALTPGRQKSYVINLNGAKKSETRTSRIIGFRDKILAGKGALDR